MQRGQALKDAIRRCVRPGMHLHFASTPSRSNAAIRELTRAYHGQRPEFVLSTTGFHSSAHLLALARLGRRYIACFFGDNYPAPRPNALYETLRQEGAVLEQWSLLSYVLALRAAACGDAYAVTRSLAGTTLGEELARAGRFFTVPDPRDAAASVGLVAALSPDLAFLHAPAASASGRAIFSPPYGEGFHAALAAKQGVILTTERLVPEEVIDEVPHLVAFPARVVRAVCEEPFGAHPQPLHFAPSRPELPSYRDDEAHYVRWRELSENVQAFAEFERTVLAAPDGAAGYRAFVGEKRLRSLVAPARRAVVRERAPLAGERLKTPLGSAERLVLLAGRTLARRIRERSHTSVLAGIGQSFAAARLAALLLGDGEGAPELMIETGISGFDPLSAHPFLLSQENVASAARLGSIELDLGALACGGVHPALAVIGCAEVDAAGAVNSSFAGGRLLVGSGGASDLASSAADVVVLARFERLVPKVEFVTSHGRRVSTIVTEQAVLERASADVPWRIRDAGLGELSAADVLDRLPFPAVLYAGAAPAAAPTAEELDGLERILRDARSRPERGEERDHA